MRGLIRCCIYGHGNGNGRRPGFDDIFLRICVVVSNFADMKRIVLLTAALVAALIWHMAGAQARWLALSHDFGAFNEETGAVTCTFSFVNDGAEPLVITAARASCGCTSPRYSREAVAPGDTGTIAVTYDPAGRPGRFSKYVAVDFGDKAPRVKLTVKGTVVGSAGSVAQRFPVDADDAMKLGRATVMFGQMKKNSLRTASIDLYNRSTDTIYPQVRALPRHIDVTVVPDTVAPGEQASLLFYFRSHLTPLYGLVCDTVELRSHPGAQPMALPLTAFVEEDFSKLTPKELDRAPVALIEPQSLDFKSLSRSSDKAVLKAEIKNTGKTPMTIRRVYSADPGVSAAVDRDKVKPGKAAIVTATVDPSALPGDMLNARVSVITNDPSHPVQVLRLVGELSD